MNIERYCQLFVNRWDVFARQLESGAYLPQKRPLTEEDVCEHLAGLWSIGTYVLNTDNTVKYVVFDLDTHDEVLTNTLIECVGMFVQSADPFLPPCLLLERSGSKGTHIWLFLSEPIDAGRVRRWLDKDFWPRWGEPTLEVFPKQDALTEGGFGNLVKAPLGIHAVSGQWSEILPYRGWAEGIDDVVPLDVALIPDLPPVVRPSSQSRGHRTGKEPASPFPCVDQILYRGAPKGTRDQAMFHLALYLYGHAVPQDLALEMCARANENFDPPIPDSDIERKVKQAYSGRYESATCGSDWLKNFCEGPCRAGWSIRKDINPGSLANAAEGTTVEVEVRKVQRERGRTRLTVAHPDAANEPTLICN